MVRIRYLAMFLSLFILVSTAQADENIIQKMQQTYQETENFQAGFEQTLTNASSGEVEERKGRIQFLKPDLLRLDTKKPEQEMLLLDGDHVWQYFEQDGIAYKHKLEEKLESETLMQLLTGDVELEKDFYLQSSEIETQNDHNLIKIALEPREAEPHLVQATLWIDTDLNFVRKLLLRDFFGNKNEIELIDLELNSQEVHQEQFLFEPESDVKVFDKTETEADH